MSLVGCCPPKSATGRWSPQRPVDRVTVGGLVGLYRLDFFLSLAKGVVVAGGGLMPVAVLVVRDFGAYLVVAGALRCCLLLVEQI